MKKDILRFALLLLVAIGAGPASSQVWKWSLTAGANGSADPHINFSEGMAPSAVNDSARAMMAALSQYRDDISGSVTTGGTATAYTLATNQGLPSTPTDGQLIAFTPNLTNGIAVTLQADGGTAYAIQTAPGTAVGAAVLIAGTPYTAKFSLSNTSWILRDFYANAFSIPLGGLMPYTGVTAPNSNFILPAGQCISTTTYATYWVLLGSPASGSCAGGQFQVIDLRGRTLAALDNLNGTAANRLTSASTGCGTAMTSVGAACANGGESRLIQRSDLPNVAPTFAGAASNLSQGNILQFGGSFISNIPNSGGLGHGFNNADPTQILPSVIPQGAVQSLNGGVSQTASPMTPPIVGVTYLLRVL